MRSNKLLLLFPTACCKNLLLRLDDNSDILEIKLNKHQLPVRNNVHLFSIFSNSLIFFKNIRTIMLENIAYVGLGFASVFFALETAWHFTACKIHDKSIKPCFYKQIGILK